MGSNRGVDDDVLKKMQELISFYDADIKTGNKSLDIILTEKNLLCCKKNIDFTCIVDGKLLSFIKDSDLYALLGNILDNAIEAVDNVPDQTKRCINFIVEKKCGAVTVCENNYYSGEIVKDGNGVIVTKKADELRHGFGLKSIREITSRYDGIFDIDTEKDIFRLSIVFFGR
jgi:sensor histidine kinase regulating citrate/malate metabolism